MNLHKSLYRRFPPDSLKSAIQPRGLGHRIHRLNGPNIGHRSDNPLCLIHLEVSYQMPFYVGWQLRGLADEFSDIVFCEVSLSGFVGGEDFGAGAGAGDDHEAGSGPTGGG